MLVFGCAGVPAMFNLNEIELEYTHTLNQDVSEMV